MIFNYKIKEHEAFLKYRQNSREVLLQLIKDDKGALKKRIQQDLNDCAKSIDKTKLF